MLTNTTTFPWQNLIHTVGVANAVFLILALVLNPKLKRTKASWLLALFLSCLACLLWLFTAVDAGWLTTDTYLQFFYDGVSVLIPALFVSYVLASLGKQGFYGWLYLPAFVFVISALVYQTAFLSQLRIEYIIFIQIIYSTLAAAVFVKIKKSLVVWPKHVLFLIVSMWVLHLFQVLRILFPHVAWLFDAVPLVGALFFLVLTWLVFTDPKILRRFTQVTTKATGTEKDLRHRLSAYMQQDKPYLHVSLTLENLSAALDVRTKEVSAIINSHGENYYEFINRHRIEEAQNILTRSEESRTSVEAIALMVGFRSRSAFYEAFRKITKMTPIEYKQKHQPN